MPEISEEQDAGKPPRKITSAISLPFSMLKLQPPLKFSSNLIFNTEPIDSKTAIGTILCQTVELTEIIQIKD